MNIKCPHCAKIVTVPDGASQSEGLCANCGQAVDVAKAERVGLSRGQVIGGCRVDGLLGVGGMAVVHRATQLSMERPVALKVLAPRLAGRERFVERFEREASALAQLSHPNIVHIFHKGVDGDTYYLVMEYVEGESLRTRLRRAGRLPLDEAARLIDQVAAGLEYAHERGVLHRDIKPENILVASDGTAKLGDFGIARILGADAEEGRQTSTRFRLGSAHYMAPEQVKNPSAADHRADIYGLGVVLYEVLTGEPPLGQFKPASRLVEGIPMAVDRVIARALAASPEERFESVAKFRAALQGALLSPTPVGAHRRPARRVARRRSAAGPVAVAVTIVVLLIIAYVIWSRISRRVEPAPSPRAASGVAGEPGPAEEDKRERAASALRAEAEAGRRPEAGGPATSDRSDKPEPRVEPTPAPGVSRAAALAAYAKGVGELAPLWARRQFVEAMAKARALAAEGDVAASPDAARWLIEDAEALAGFWVAVEAGAQSLKAWEPISVGGVSGKFQKFEGGSVFVQAGPVAFAKKLTDLKTAELIRLALKTRELKTGRDHLALALLWLHSPRPNIANARSELDLAEKAGLDVSRHRELYPSRGVRRLSP